MAQPKLGSYIGVICCILITSLLITAGFITLAVAYVRQDDYVPTKNCVDGYCFKEPDNNNCRKNLEKLDALYDPEKSA